MSFLRFRLKFRIYRHYFQHYTSICCRTRGELISLYDSTLPNTFCNAVFKSIGCWADSPKDRAMKTLEGKHSQLQNDYKTRVNALMKCADAADAQNLKLFGIQNGGQCFGGKNDVNTYRKYGASTECQGTSNIL